MIGVIAHNRRSNIGQYEGVVVFGTPHLYTSPPSFH
jgi:hypothetical protein